MDQRPETQASPQVFYNAQEAARYHNAADSIQADLTRQSLRLMGLLPVTRPILLLDVGCGSGLSGRVCQEHGVCWMGLDISPGMLEVASGTLLKEKVHGKGSSSLCQGLVLADMGRTLPLLPACATTSNPAPLFDAAISISAVQWLLFRQDWWEATTSFFTGLRKLLVPGALAMLQVYVLREHEMIKLVHAARAAGFTSTSAPTTSDADPHHTSLSTLSQLHDGFCLAMCDFPHGNASRKYSLILRSPLHAAHADVASVQYQPPAEMPGVPLGGNVHMCINQNPQNEGVVLHMPLLPVGSVFAPECPLAWHVGGTCAVWWAHQLHAMQGSGTTTLAQLGSRFQISNEGLGPEEKCMRQHHTHARKLAHMLQRAMVLPAAPPGLLSPCAAANFSMTSNTEHPPPAASGKGRKRGLKRQPPSTPSQQLPAAQEQLPTALAKWRTQHANCGVSDGHMITRITALAKSSRLFPCCGHTCVVLLDHTQSLSSDGGWDADAAQCLVASMCDVEKGQVHSIKIEVVEPPRHKKSATTTSTNITSLCATAQGDGFPGGDDPTRKRQHIHKQGPVQEHTSSTLMTTEQGQHNAMSVTTRMGEHVATVGGGGSSSNGGGNGGVGGGAAQQSKGKSTGRGHARSCEDKESLSDSYLGAQVSYWRCCGPYDGMLVSTGTLRAPGVCPPYCVLNAHWTVPQCTEQPATQAALLPPCGSEQGGNKQDRSDALNSIAARAQSLLLGIVGSHTGTKPAGNYADAATAVESVVVEMHDCCCGASDGGRRLCCQLMGAVWDCRSTYGVPGLLAIRCQESPGAFKVEGEGDVSQVQVEDEVGSSEKGAQTDGQAGVLKQNSALAVLHASMERCLSVEGWPGGNC